jgi:outer membrane protein assembly factor BamB
MQQLRPSACTSFLFVSIFLLFGSMVQAGDWPMLGRDQTRNPVSPEKGAAAFWQVEKRDDQGGVIQPARNIKWTARLGAVSYGDPVIANGLVWVGTNNLQPGDYRAQKDASVLMCVRESDGRPVYCYASPRLEPGRYHDWPFASLVCSPLIENDRLWFTTNRCETVCLDIGPLLRREGGARVIWQVDMMKELGVSPVGSLMSIAHSCSVAGYQDYLYVITGNGVDEGKVRVPKPEAPSLVCFAKKSGKVVWQDNSPGKNILDGQWASPLVIEIGGQGQVIAPLGDGWLRSLDAQSGKMLWEFDMNPKEAKWSIGRGRRQSILATPVYHEGRVYISSGRHPVHDNRVGRLCCIDPTKRGDFSAELALDAGGKPLPRRRLQAVERARGEKAVPNPNSGLVWDFAQRDDDGNGMNGSVGSVAVHAGLVIAADNLGYVHCLDARTGKKRWTYDTNRGIVSSPLIVDGKVYVTVSDGDVLIFRLSADPATAMRKTGNEYEPIARMEMPGQTLSSPVFANGVLYVAAGHELFAIQDEPKAAAGAFTPGYWPQWRGPDRTNVSQEKGLLQQWPVEGPPLLWRAAPLGQGIAPVSVADGRIFTSGYQDGSEFAIALDEQTGQRAWAVYLGSSVADAGIHRLMRWLSQRAPTVDGDRLYYVTSAGNLICLRAADGRELWRKSYPEDFKARMPAWTFCDCPLVDGDKLICTPGGAEAVVVALNKKTGEVIWKSAGLENDRAGYSPLMVAEVGGIRQYVAFLAHGLAGVAAKDGKLLWRYDKPARTANSHAPIVRGDLIFCGSGYGWGIVLLKLVPTGQEIRVEEQYFHSEPLSSIQDSSVPVALGDYAYAFRTPGWLACIEMKTGKLVWQAKPGPARPRAGYGRGSLTCADGCLYVRDANGGVALIAATPKGYLEQGAFKVPDHQEALGATAPVIAGGRLYLRENEVLFCYDIRAHSAGRPRGQPRNFILPPLPPPSQSAVSSERSRTGKQRVPDALFVPTPQDVVEKMLELARTSKKDLVYDLGSGDGRIVIAAAKKYGCKAVGYEIDAELVKLSRQEVHKSQLQDLVRIEQEDIFTRDLSSADVVAVYLPPRLLERLLPQLAKLKPGARIVSHYFEIPGYKPDQAATIECKEDGNRHTVYLWTAPLKKRN